MLNTFIINSIDTFNIIYLWTILMKKSNGVFKLLFSVFTISILITLAELLGLNFMFIYLIDVIIIKSIYKVDLKNTILAFILTLLVDMSLQLIFSLAVYKFVINYTLRAIIIEFIILILITIVSKIKFLNKNYNFGNINNNIIIYFIFICGIYAIVTKFI